MRRRAGRGGEDGRSGVALLAVVMVGLALTLLANAGLMMGMATIRTSAREARHAEVYAALSVRMSEAERALMSMDGPLSEDIAARPLAPELLRLRADSMGQSRVAIAWAFHRQTRLDAMLAGVRAGEPMDWASRTRTRAASADSCASGLSAPPGLPPTWTGEWEADDPLRIGPVFGPDLDGWSELSISGSTPDPPEALYVEGDLSILGDRLIEGMVLVDGSLVLQEGVEVHGWVGVAGDLELRSGARIRGIVRAGGRVVVDPGAGIHVAPCVAVDAAYGSRPLQRPAVLPWGNWPSDHAW